VIKQKIIFLNITKVDALEVIIIGIQTLGRSGQRPELIQATGMALVRCILGKFLGVVCHCFPPALEDEGKFFVTLTCIMRAG
jgi:hypothetical protein